MSVRRQASAIAASYLRRAEAIVLVLIALVLVVLALLLLGNSVLSLIAAVQVGRLRELAVEILDTVLLVMMTMEIVYTVSVSLESRRLVAEPFLVIGAIAAIRRMLVITAQTAKLETENPEAFRSILIELGLLALIIVAVAVSIYVLRRSHTFLPPTDPEEED